MQPGVSTNANDPDRGRVLRKEIEVELDALLPRLGVTEGSVLVRAPEPAAEHLFFLAWRGETTTGMRGTAVGRDSTAGKVSRTGKAHRVANPYLSSRPETRMLAIPLVNDREVVGVAQFLGDRTFGADDEALVAAESGHIARKVAEFVRDPDNYARLGLHSPPSPAEAAILFCDLSASSSLFDVLAASGAIACLDDYLTRTVDAVLGAGGSVDQYLGDGALCRFLPDDGPEAAARRAVRAAVDATASFQAAKDSWLASRWEVAAVFSRIGIAYGDFREALIGPARKREPVILGSGVHRAAELCATASRRKDVVLVDRRMAALLGDGWTLGPGPSADSFEVLGRA
jgi:class 3 adenylate cyclase